MQQSTLDRLGGERILAKDPLRARPAMRPVGLYSRPKAACQAGIAVSASGDDPARKWRAHWRSAHRSAGGSKAYQIVRGGVIAALEGSPVLGDDNLSAMVFIGPIAAGAPSLGPQRKAYGRVPFGAAVLLSQ